MRPLFCFFVLLFLVSCKGPSLTPVNTGSAPEWSGDERYDVLVVAYLYNGNIRSIFEDQLTAKLKEEGVNAVASHVRFPRLSTLTAEAFTAYLGGSPRAAMLYCHAVNVTKEETSSSKKDPSIFTGLLGGNTEEWDASFVALMENSLFVHGHPTAVWWSRSKLEVESDKVPQIVGKYARAELTLMKDAQVIERLK